MQPKNYGGLDTFKIIAALLVVAIHISPLSGYSAAGDFFFTRVLARVAVPFFFMVTGQFILFPYLFQKDTAFSIMEKAVRKILLLYGIAILLYLPIGFYAGQYEGLTLGAALRALIFDGTFYHLWYFPACATGLLLLWFLRRFCSLKALTALTIFLYLVALFGDSYYQLIAQIPWLTAIYDFGFRFFSYTRNGIFMAPLFLLMGAWFGREKPLGKTMVNAIGFAGSLLLMTGEGFLLRYFSLQRHDSMYVLLPICLFFLYRLLLTWKITAHPRFRTISTWVYILHPAVIVIVRGGAKILDKTDLLVNNHLVLYILVCLISAALATGIAWLQSRKKVSSISRGRAWIELDRKALRENVETLTKLLPAHCTLMPAVKANAYGHGAILLARELNSMGIYKFCVACLSEGIDLRRHGVRGEILILGYTHPTQFPLLRRWRLTQTVVNGAYAQELDRYGKRLQVQVGIDTGMHRLGEDSSHIDEIYKIFTYNHLNITGLFSHLCAADRDDPVDQAFTKAQADALYGVIAKLRARGISLPSVHLLASSGILNYPELSGDYARVGIALYGVLSSDADWNRAGADLRPVLSLKVRVAAVKYLKPGEHAGYGCAFTADQPKKLAILSIGYGDGLPRALSCGRGCVLLHGHRVPIAGRICMDQTLVDVTEISEVKPGDIAVLIGSDREESISVYDVADACGTITNEILSQLGDRLERMLV